MAKEFSLQIFLIGFFVKGACYVVKIWINITGCVEITGYLSETFFIISLKENIAFVKCLETSFGSNTCLI